jgi:hypothetical protein
MDDTAGANEHQSINGVAGFDVPVGRPVVSCY